MSTKSSLGYYKEEEIKTCEIHIYEEHMDGKYYIENNISSIELPKEVAIKLGKVLNKVNNAKNEKDKLV